jgi:hypothetical protein
VAGWACLGHGALANTTVTAEGFTGEDSSGCAAGSDWFLQMVFVAAAGSTIANSIGVCAELLGALMIGARKGQFRADA